MTTEHKIGWGNLEYDTRMGFSETTGGIRMSRKCQKAKYQKKANVSTNVFCVKLWIFLIEPLINLRIRYTNSNSLNHHVYIPHLRSHV